MSKIYLIDSLKEIVGDDQDFMVVVVEIFLIEILLDLEVFVGVVENDNRELVY